MQHLKQTARSLQHVITTQHKHYKT